MSDVILTEVEIAYQLEQASFLAKSERCTNNAPYICYPLTEGDTWGLSQGCCNSWYCPRCSNIRAKHEYHRIRAGAEKLSNEGKNLYFVTLTCRGKGLTALEGDENYLKWTNRLLSSWRAKTKKNGGEWNYVQVTERQRRGLAHSHMITTMIPSDAVVVSAGEWSDIGHKFKHDGLWSQWLSSSAVKAGLGKMVDITQVRTSGAVASYVSKYLFKEIKADVWPKGWKRVRYSHSWPKAPEVLAASEGAFPVFRYSHWIQVSKLPRVKARDEAAYEAALAALCFNVLPPKG